MGLDDNQETDMNTNTDSTSKVSIKKLGNGSYMVNGRYLVGRFTGGDWRWSDINNIGVGGEWRSTKREVMLDLREWIGGN
jgi:hypothetical protein